MSFKPGVNKKLKNYVYRLIDPRTGKTFYVGRGRGNRVFDHAKGIRIKAKNYHTPLPQKIELINEIKHAEREVKYIIHRHDVPDYAIEDVEAAVIDAFPNLTNIKKGYKSDKKGPRTIDEINRSYGLEDLEIKPEDKLLLFNVNQLPENYTRAMLKQQVQCAWRIKPETAKKVDYILAIKKGVSIGAFTNPSGKWLRATKENFPYQSKAFPKRYGFHARWVDGETLARYCGEPDSSGKLPLGKIVMKKHLHIRRPERYINL